VGTIGEAFRWVGIGLAAMRVRVVRRYRAMLARLFKRDIVVARSERKFHALLEAAPDAIVIVDWHGHIQLVNAQAERTFGYGRVELLGENLSRLIPERYRSAHRAEVRRYLRDATARSVGGDLEIFGLRKDGTEFPAEIRLGPLETDQGLLVSSVIRDVSDRKRAEAALREALTEAEAEERFRTAFEEAPVGITLAGIDGGLLKVNQALCEITGYSREELEATTLAKLLHPGDRERDAAEMTRLLRGETRRYRAEQRYLTAGGETVAVEVSVALTRDRDGAPLHLLAQVNDITDRKRIENQLHYLADHDPLTGLLNRRSFEKELELMIDRGPAGAVLAVDLDHFKFVNDTLGHSVGDDLIVRVASVLREHLRSSDVLARLGGDEFAALLHGASADQARLVATKLLDALSAEARGAQEASPMRWVTASIGVAWVGESHSSAEEILIEADIAMYDAKAAGRNRVALYDAAGNRQSLAQEGLSWAQKIRHALEENRFVLHAQPILSLNGDLTPHHELLIRMRGDNDELIAPGEFLAIAERVDLVQSIDRWVFRNAIEILAGEQRAGRAIKLAVNLSARSMVDPEMTVFVAQELTNAGIDGRGLCIELTETAAVANVRRAQRFAHELRELGCDFALDDFGSGFASFYHLKQIHFDYLKIDGEFIRDLPDSKINQLVVQSVVGIARGLGRRTVAEFVGDAETLELLRAYDVDFAQGFYVGRPQPLDLLDLTTIPAVTRLATDGPPPSLTPTIVASAKA
jgi:diguanylate cyclase (GGDEF)-like protein/PAS domain S-box-containing protein